MAVRLESLSGFVLNNRYEFVEQIGRGIYATVYEVKDRNAENETETRKAIKVIPYTELSQNLVSEGKFLMENQHPHLLKVYDLVYLEGRLFMVMEYCDGRDLATVIRKMKLNGCLLSEPTALKWLNQLLQVLKFIHERGVIHRDIQPRNVLLHEDDIRLGDFGVSRVLEDSPEKPHMIVGTAYYSSPEMIRSEGYNQKSDIWSLGCILYELVALKKAFNGKNVIEVFGKVVNMDLPPWPVGYSKELQAIFTRMLTYEPSDRPTAAVLLQTPYLETLQSVSFGELFPGAAASRLVADADDVYDDEVDIVLPRTDDRRQLDTVSQCSIETADEFVYSDESFGDGVKVSSTRGSSRPIQVAPRDVEVQMKVLEDTADSNVIHKFTRKFWSRDREMIVLRGGGQAISQHSAQSSAPPAPPPPHSTSAPNLPSQAKPNPPCIDHHTVNFIVRQKLDDPECVYIDCCKKQLTELRLAELESMGYTQGPRKSKDIVLHDKSDILVTTSGPVQLDVDGRGMEDFNIFFDSELDNAGEEGWMTPTYQQEGGEKKQRGFVNFSVIKSNISTLERNRSASRLDETVDYVLLCALPLVIKQAPDCIPSTDHVDIVPKHQEPQAHPYAIQPRSDQYWNPVVPIVTALKGDEWVHLAKLLNYDAANIVLFRENKNDMDAVATMLIDWLGRTPDLANKVETLSNALQNIGHNDVANTIRQREQNAQEDRKFMRVVNDLVDDAALLREHEMFLRLLGLSDADILDTSSSLPSRSLKGSLREGLKLWRSRRGDDGIIKTIVECLKEMKLRRLAEVISERHLGESL